MPKTTVQKVIFGLLMSFFMVLAMEMYNTGLRNGGLTNAGILNALREEIPAATIDGVKRRCNAGMGRCQGGFCGPRVLELISRTRGIDPLDVLQDKAGSNVLLCETKQEGTNHD